MSMTRFGIPTLIATALIASAALFTSTSAAADEGHKTKAELVEIHKEKSQERRENIQERKSEHRDNIKARKAERRDNIQDRRQTKRKRARKCKKRAAKNA